MIEFNDGNETNNKREPHIALARRAQCRCTFINYDSRTACGQLKGTTWGHVRGESSVIVTQLAAVDTDCGTCKLTHNYIVANHDCNILIFHCWFNNNANILPVPTDFSIVVKKPGEKWSMFWTLSQRIYHIVFNIYNRRQFLFFSCHLTDLLCANLCKLDLLI